MRLWGMRLRGSRLQRGRDRPHLQLLRVKRVNRGGWLPLDSWLPLDKTPTPSLLVGIQEVGETLVQLFEKELADWDAFTTALLKALRQNDDIDRLSITDRKLWTQSWGSKLIGGKNVTMALNPDHPVQTPRGYITSGFFQKNPQGH